MGTELSACCCGGKVKVNHGKFHDYDEDSQSVICTPYWSIACQNVEVCGLATANLPSLETAIAAWNRRTPPPQGVPVEALRYVTSMYLLSSSGKPLGDRETYCEHMFTIDAWLATQRPTAGD